MKQIETRFVAYEFTPQEYDQAQQFNELNIAYLKTLRATEAEKKISLQFDPINPLSFAQQEAESSGIIGILDTLINGHYETVAANLRLALESSDSST